MVEIRKLWNNKLEDCEKIFVKFELCVVKLFFKSKDKLKIFYFLNES